MHEPGLLPNICLRVWQKDPGVLAEIQQLAESEGLQATTGDGQVNIRGKVSTGITLGLDPITAFVALAFGLVRARWASTPQVCELFKETKNRWKATVRRKGGSDG